MIEVRIRGHQRGHELVSMADQSRLNERSLCRCILAGQSGLRTPTGFDHEMLVQAETDVVDMASGIREEGHGAEAGRAGLSTARDENVSHCCGTEKRSFQDPGAA